MGCLFSSTTTTIAVDRSKDPQQQQRRRSTIDDDCSSILDVIIPPSKSFGSQILAKSSSLPDFLRTQLGIEKNYVDGKPRRRILKRGNKRGGCVSELALAMHRAEFTATAVIGVSAGLYLTQERVYDLIGHARADGSVFKLIDGHLYIDYKHIGRVPPGMKVKE